MEEVDISEINVLLVEDDDVSNFLATYVLNDLGIKNVDVVENGSEAFSSIKTKSPDILFLDLNMPVMDGFELLQLIEENSLCTNTSVVILTSSVRLADKENCLKYPFVVKYLEKPLDDEKLQQVLKLLC